MSRELERGRGTNPLFLAALVAPAAIAAIALRVAPVVSGVIGATGAGGPAVSAEPWLNALAIALVEALLVTAIAVPTARELRRYDGRPARVAAALIALPFFLPAAVLATTIASILGVRPGSEAAGFARLTVVVLTGVVQTAGITAIVASSVSARTQPRPAPHATALAVVMIVLVRLSGAVAPTLDAVAAVSTSATSPAIALPWTAVFSALTPGSSAGSERLWLAQAAVQGLLVTGVFLFARPRVERLALSPAKDREAGGGAARAAIPAVWTAVCLVIVTYLVGRPLVSAGTAFEGLRAAVSDTGMGDAFIRHGIVALASTVVAIFFVTTTAYGLDSATNRGRRVWVAVLLFLIATSAPAAHDYFFYRELRMLNTIYPWLVRGLLPATMAFALVLHHRGVVPTAKTGTDQPSGEPYRFFSGFVAPNRRAILALAIVHFSQAWGLVGAVGVYMTHGARAATPATIFLAIASQGRATDASLLLLGTLVALPPVTIFLIARPLMSDDTLWSGLR